MVIEPLLNIFRTWGQAQHNSLRFGKHNAQANGLAKLNTEPKFWPGEDWTFTLAFLVGELTTAARLTRKAQV